MHTSPSPDNQQPVGAIIEIQCSTDGNPHPVLSVLMHDGTEEKVVDIQETAFPDFKIFLTLSENLSGKRIFCRATSGESVKDSESVVYETIGKFIPLRIVFVKTKRFVGTGGVSMMCWLTLLSLNYVGLTSVSKSMTNPHFHFLCKLTLLFLNFSVER